ncbi:hypothetical protein ONE63_006065 [Megalurothrips usitatus]|uniref:BZIP domain-containing protein n=1 Tax=Megalurothrips usitatus TaxID=439358 RepID=A0AAV7XT92_9NEOP|nr:hypothetical protein ONE63_006065 [Megalurothrips usitatus]
MDYYQAAPDLPSMLMQELCQQGLGHGLQGLQGLQGLPTGVQTTTTPTLTLTPTTLRCFAATADLLSGMMDDDQPTYHNAAGFEPPIVQPSSSSYMNMVDAKAWQGGSVTTMPTLTALPALPAGACAANTGPSMPAVSLATTSPSPSPSPSPPAMAAASTTPPRRNVGGRRPTKAKGISPEEEERRQVRRERNKQAAARCRKRRMDHTNSLVKETEGLEHKKQGLQVEIQELNRQLEELSYILKKHVCRHPHPNERSVSPPDIKPQFIEVKQERLDTDLEPPAKRPMLSMPAPSVQPKPSRPTSLPVASHTNLRSTASEIAGISITTPSTGIPLNFDSLMDGGTGLTPVSGPLVPSCSSQQRNQNCVDLASPDSNISNKLVSL